MHKKLLCTRVPYFAKAFGSRFQEAQTGEIRCDTTTRAFELVLHWLYSGRVLQWQRLELGETDSDTQNNITKESNLESSTANPNELAEADSKPAISDTDDASDHSEYRYIEAYLLAEYWCLDALQESLIEAIIDDNMEQDRQYPMATINTIYRRSHSESRLRRWFTAKVVHALQAANEKTLEWLTEQRDGDELPCYEFAMDVIRRLGNSFVERNANPSLLWDDRVWY